MNDEPILTAAQFAEIIKKTKPYLVELEAQVETLHYGTLEVKFKVRAGVVEEMVFISGKSWNRVKEGSIDAAPHK